MKKKLVNLMVVFTMMFCCTFLLGMTAKAESVTEEESNDTKDEAQLISANSETAAGAYNGTYTGQYMINGYISRTDPGWFKVYLTAGTKYITCNGSNYDYHIEDEDGDYITAGEYTKASFGPTAYRFTISSADYYYVNIVGLQTTSTSFILGVGSPTYSVSSCDISANSGTVTMSSGTSSVSAIFNGTALSSIPEDAVAYTVKMSGVKTTAVKSINLVNNTTGSNLSLSTYTWQKTGVGALNLPVSARWTATFAYYKDITFTPVLQVYYAYPVYSTMVQ